MAPKVIVTVFFLLFLSANGGFGFTQDVNELMLVTNDFPPYAFGQEGHISGIAAEIVKELMSRAGVDGKIIMLPWNRALKYSKSRKMMLFPYTRMPYREKDFKWIGPIMKDCFVFTVLSSTTRTFSDIEDFRSLRIGVTSSTPTLARLKELGFKHLQVVASEKLNAKKLVIAKRIDAWFIPYLIMKHTLTSAGIDESQVRIALRDLKVHMYIGASSSVSDQTIALWQKNFNEMKGDGTYQRIVKAALVDEKCLE